MLTMIEPDRALELVLQHARERDPEQRPLADAGGLVLAEAVQADRDFPPFPRAMMDGYAVCAADAGRAVEQVGEVAAGQIPQVEVSAGRCVAIMTGAPCPAGTEAVVKVEDTSVEQGRVQLPDSIPAGQHVAAQGSECPQGQQVLAAGVRVSPLAVAVLASVGQQDVLVVRPPRAAVITTGSELADLGVAPEPHQIRNSNGPMLAAQARRTGWCGPLAMLHAADTLEQLSAALERAGEADVIMLTGGVSMGRYDLVPEALKRLGATTVFHKVTQKPGKPLLLARRDDQLIFGLPGNPLSSHFCFHRYVGPCLAAMAGHPPQPASRPGLLTAPLSVKGGRTKFILARAELRQGDAAVTPMLGKGSADIFTGPTANAYLVIPPGRHELVAGDAAEYQWIGGHHG